MKDPDPFDPYLTAVGIAWNTLDMHRERTGRAFSSENVADNALEFLKRAGWMIGREVSVSVRAEMVRLGYMRPAPRRAELIAFPRTPGPT